MEASPDLRLLTLSDVDAAANVAAQAFIDDPLCAFMLPFRRSRCATLYKFFRAYGEVSIKNKRVYGTGQPLQGVAFWKFPDQAELSVSVKSLGRLLPLFFTLYPIGLLRARTILAHVERMHEKYASQPHFYLDNLAVLAAGRGQGLSSKLVRPFLAMANERKMNVYTDTENRANVPLYEHFGFQVMEEAPIGDTGVTIWALRRPIQ
jgi:ribosomal protein S18 acetylase RimI-like enzyme